MTLVPPAVKTMLQRLDLNAVSGTASAQLSIMANILAAESEEEIFAAANAGTVNGQNTAGRPFTIQGFDWKRAAAGYVEQGAFPFYALVQAHFLDTGEDATLVCGGFTFVSVLDKLDQGGYLEGKKAETYGGYPMVLESRRMSSGFDVLIPHPYEAPKPK